MKSTHTRVRQVHDTRLFTSHVSVDFIGTALTNSTNCIHAAPVILEHGNSRDECIIIAPLSGCKPHTAIVPHVRLHWSPRRTQIRCLQAVVYYQAVLKRYSLRPHLSIAVRSPNTTHNERFARPLDRQRYEPSRRRAWELIFQASQRTVQLLAEAVFFSNEDPVQAILAAALRQRRRVRMRAYRFDTSKRTHKARKVAQERTYCS
jgi:hypothetical protein